jgi:hypothetical protein
VAFLGRQIAGEHINGKLVGAIFEPGMPKDLICFQGGCRLRYPQVVHKKTTVYSAKGIN